MSESVKKLFINTTAIVLAFVIIAVLVSLYAKMKPCACKGGGVPNLKPGDGTVIDNTPAPVQDTAGYGEGGFDYAN